MKPTSVAVAVLCCVLGRVAAQPSTTQPQAQLIKPAAHSHYPTFTPGEVTQPKKVITVIIQGDPYESQLKSFGAALVSSNWYKTLAANYKLNPTPGHASITVAPPSDISKTEQEWMDFITNRVSSKYPPEKGNIYLLYLLDHYDIAQKSDCGYHPKIADQVIGVIVQRGPSCDTNTRAVYKSELDHHTATASHELMEGITDNLKPGWSLKVTGKVTDASPWASAHHTGTIELADMCGGTQVKEGDFVYQRFYSNRQVAENIDPCAPVRFGPGVGPAAMARYYGVSTPVSDDSHGPWYSIPYPSTADSTQLIALTGWSTTPSQTWYVQADRSVCGDDVNQPSGTSSGAKAHFQDPALSGTPVTINGSGHFPIRNGERLNLTVTVKHDAAHPVPHNSWCLYTLYSIALDLATNNPVPYDDFYHRWIIGVWVP